MFLSMHDERSCDTEETDSVPLLIEHEILSCRRQQTSVGVHCIREQPGKSTGLRELDEDIFAKVKVF